MQYRGLHAVHWLKCDRLNVHHNVINERIISTVQSPTHCRYNREAHSRYACQHCTHGVIGAVNHHIIQANIRDYIYIAKI